MTRRGHDDKVPFLDLVGLHAPLQAELEAAALRVVRSGHYIGGEEVEAFEEELGTTLQGAHVVGVSSGTDALLVALMAAGVGPGDEVITTSMSFFATAGCIARLGARPVFVEVHPRTFNLDPEALSLALTPNTKAVVPVHLFGQLCQMDQIMAMCQAAGVPVIADAAQAIGASLGGQGIGQWGQSAALSFFPTKNLGACGDGGAVLTTDPALADLIRSLASHGSGPKYYHARVGGNFRLDALQAALLRVKLPHLARWNQARRQNAALYMEGLDDLPGLTLPLVPPGHQVSWHQFCVVVDKGRDQLQQALAARGIETMVYYPRPLHEQACFAHLGYAPEDLPIAHRLSQQLLALPIAPGLRPAQIARVCREVRRWCEEAQEGRSR